MKYWPIFSLKLSRDKVVVLSSAFRATQILENRPFYCSDRPPFHVMGERVFKGDGHCDESYTSNSSRSQNCKEHVIRLETKTTQLLRDICLNPGSLMLHPGRFSNSIVMSLGMSPLFFIIKDRHD